MSKPDDVPQDVWDLAEVVAKEATRDAMRDPLMPYYITVAPHIARAIMAAKADEREACAEAGAHAAEQFIRYKIGSEWSDEAGNAVEVSIRNRV